MSRIRVLATIVLGVVLVPTGASAYLGLRPDGRGILQAAADQLPVGTRPAASVLGRNVELRWVPSRFTDGVAVTSYEVRRHAAGSDNVAATIPCAGTVDGADGRVRCDESGVPSGSWTYAVTPLHGPWRGTEGPRSGAISVASPPTNTSPAADDDEAAVASGSSINIAVLANDADADGDVLRVASVTPPARGTALVVDAGARVRYLAPAGYVGIDRFAYEVSDGRGGAARASVTVTVAEEVSSFVVAPGGTLQTDGNTTPERPVASSVTVPDGGLVTIVETTSTGIVRDGFSFVGTSIQITAPPATVEAPLVLRFRVDASALPPGGTLAKRIAALRVFRDGKAIENCRLGTAATTADPDPCMTLKTYESWTNDVVITILSSHASEWSFGLPLAETRPGYRLLGEDGGVFDFGDAGFFGSRGDDAVDAPIVGLAATPTGKGYWLAAADGGVFAFGDAPFAGSLGGAVLRSPIVGLAATPSGRGYWLVGADGGVFAFGDAEFLGGLAETPLTSPVVGMASSASGAGYWLVAADGGVFGFGDAGFAGSLGAHTLNAAVVGMAASATGGGYWLVAADGGVFAFGDAAYEGSLGDVRLNAPVVGLALADGGYWLVASDGGVFSFGGAPFLGSLGGMPLAAPVRGIVPD